MGDGFRIFGNLFHAYLRERDVGKILAMISEDIISLGTGSREVAVGKEEFESLCSAEMALNPDPIEFRFLEAREIRTADTRINFYAKIRIFTPAPRNVKADTPSFVCRFTGSCKLADGKWLVDSIHISLPHAGQEESAFLPDFHQRQSAGISPYEAQKTLAAFLPDIIPCGVLCAYVEKGLPFYLVNDELLGYLDYTYDEFLDITEGMAINIVHPDDREMVQRIAIEGCQSNREYESQFRLVKKDLSFIWVYTRGKPLKLADGRDILIGVIINISKMVALQEELTNEASRDVLTPVFNRRAMIKMVESSFLQNPHGCFFIIDIDNFKQLNDTLGHQAGDAVLQEAATIMLRRTRSTDIVARIGGDEFVIYYPGLRNAAVAKKRADQLCKDFAQVTKRRYGAANVSLSIGAVIRSEDMDFGELYQCADKALYAIKKSGKNGYSLCQPSNSEEPGIKGAPLG